MTTPPLTGIRVLDLTQVYAGPTCTRILSDLGADVIKIEGLSRIDITRNFAIADNSGEEDYWNRAGYFLYRNGGKRSLTLDLNEPRSVEIFKKLIPQTDIVAESFTPRVMAKFGLDYDSLRKLKQDIIMISLSGYGKNGPWSEYTGYGMGLEPASGISSLTGYSGGDPLRTGISFTDPYSGVVGAGAVLSALVYRRRTGKGQHIDLSEQEAAIPVVGYALMDKAMNGRDPQRIGNRSPWYAPQGCYRCVGEDNWLVITVRDDAEWAALSKALGHPEWADDRFATLDARRKNHHQIDGLISAWTAEQDQRDAMAKLQDAGVIAAAVLNPKQVLLNQHLKERAYFDRVDTGNHGIRPAPRQLGARFSAFEIDSNHRAPSLGEHNKEILQGELGLSDEEFAKLEDDNVVGYEPVSEVPLQLMRMFVQWPTTTYLNMGAAAALETDYKEQLGIDGASGTDG
jgi:crotonobetainyl-CoA:carnitine CoA-transferase CaiB-like acyl-CoA transferase